DQWGRPIAPPQGQPPQQQPPQQQVQPAPAPPPTPFVITTDIETARADALACADALENYHLDVARTRCADAIAKDDKLALAHLWMAMAAPPPSVGAPAREPRSA